MQGKGRPDARPRSSRLPLSARGEMIASTPLILPLPESLISQPPLAIMPNGSTMVGSATGGSAQNCRRMRRNESRSTSAELRARHACSRMRPASIQEMQEVRDDDRQPREMAARGSPPRKVPGGLALTRHRRSNRHVMAVRCCNGAGAARCPLPLAVSGANRCRLRIGSAIRTTRRGCFSWFGGVASEDCDPRSQ